MSRTVQPLYPIRLYRKKRKVMIPLVLSLLLNLVTWAWLLIHIRPQDQHIFLHYNILFGVDSLGEWWRVLTLPIAGIIIILANAILGWFLYAKDSFVSTLLNGSAALVQVILLVAAGLLVFLNV